MKSLLLLLMLVGNATAQTTQEPLTFYQTKFGGVDNFHDSARIDDADFQDARNVLTHRGYLEKRPGSFRVSDGIKPGYPISYLKEFVNGSNNDLLIVQASTQIFSSDFGEDFVEIATVNVNGITDSVSAFGKHFFVNGYDTPWYTTGTDYVAVSSIPSCRLIAFAQERLFCANASGFESTVYASAFGDYTNWTIDPDFPADSPNSWTMDAQDGKALTCLYSSPYGVLAWKNNKMFIIKGFDNEDFYKWRLSENIGCIDQRSIQLREGMVTWLGQDGVYEWGGGNNAPKLISTEIDTSIKQIRQSVANIDRRQVTTPDEFIAGTISNNGPTPSWSTTIAAGSIVPSTWTHVDTSSADFAAGTLTNISTTMVDGSIRWKGEAFTDGNYTASPIWTVKTGAFSIVDGALQCDTDGIIFTSSTFASGSMFLDLKYTGELARITWLSLETGPGEFADPGQRITMAIQSGTAGIFLYGTATEICHISAFPTLNTWGTYKLSISGNAFTLQTPVGTCNGTATNYPTTSKWFAFNQSYTPDSPNAIDNISSVYSGPGVFISTSFDTSLSTPVGGPLQVTATIPSGSSITYRVADSADDVTYGSWVEISTSVNVPLNKRYWKYELILTSGVFSDSPVINDVTFNAISTGTWDSEVLFIGNTITSWGQFNAIVNETTSGNASFYVRTATYTFTQTDTSIAWVAQTNGQNVNTSTGAYAQVRVTSTVKSSTETAQVDSITLNWTEGAVKSVASLYFDKNYFLAVNIDTNSTTNETTLVLQRTGKWTIFDGLSYGALGLYNLLPYAGDGLTESKIWRIMNEGSYFDDNDQAINAYVVTKDFQFAGANQGKIVRQLYLESFPTVTGTLSLGYSVDKSTTYATTAQTLLANTIFNDEVQTMFPGYAQGRYIRFKFSNATLDEYFKLDAYTVLGEYENLYRR